MIIRSYFIVNQLFEAFAKGKSPLTPHLCVEQPGDEQVVLYATVKGSGRAIYSQEININRLFDGSINISGECRCPAGYNCKHNDKR